MSYELAWSPGLEEYAESLEGKGDLLQAAITEKINILAATLLVSIQGKLSGEVLQQRTGTLLRSVEMQAAEWVGAACQTAVGIDDGAPSFKYAIAFEMGGLGYYEIVPKNTLALAFEGPEGMIFAKKINHPPAAQHAFIAPSVEELRPQFMASLQETLDIVLGVNA